MISAKEAVVWVNNDTHEVMVWKHKKGCPEDYPARRPDGYWCDPIGAAYSEWQEASNADRVRLMMETAIDLAMQGFALKDVLTAFAQVTEFRALGGQSFPMCRALTSALLGKCLEPNTMSFKELLRTYEPEEPYREHGGVTVTVTVTPL
jgi:hypothetical protein